MKKNYIYELPEEWQDAARVFAALGDPSRQRILLLFEPGEALSIKAIADLFPLSRTAVVHHLNVLERAGILRHERKGKSSFYSLLPHVVLEAVEGLRQYIFKEFPSPDNGEDEKQEGKE